MRTRAETPPRQQGFTLTELMVVVGLMVLLTAMTVPSLSKMFADRAIETAISKVQGQIYRARSMAARNNLNYAISFNTVSKLRNAMYIYSQRAVKTGSGEYDRTWIDEPKFLTEFDSSGKDTDPDNRLGGYETVGNVVWKGGPGGGNSYDEPNDSTYKATLYMAIAGTDIDPAQGLTPPEDGIRKAMSVFFFRTADADDDDDPDDWHFEECVGTTGFEIFETDRDGEAINYGESGLKFTIQPYSSGMTGYYTAYDPDPGDANYRPLLTGSITVKPAEGDWGSIADESNGTDKSNWVTIARNIEVRLGTYRLQGGVAVLPRGSRFRHLGKEMYDPNNNDQPDDEVDLGDPDDRVVLYPPTEDADGNGEVDENDQDDVWMEFTPTGEMRLFDNDWALGEMGVGSYDPEYEVITVCGTIDTEDRSTWRSIRILPLTGEMEPIE